MSGNGIDPDELRRRLADAASYLPEPGPPELPIAEHAAQRPLMRRVVLPAAGACAVVAAVALLATFLPAHSHAHPAAAAASSTTAASTLPGPNTTQAPAGSSPVVPPPSARSSAAPTTSAAPTGCTSADLSQSARGGGGLPFQGIAIISLKNTGDRTCSLQGYATVAAYDGSGNALTGKIIDSTTGPGGWSLPEPGLVTVAPGSSAMFYTGMYFTPDTICHPASDADGVAYIRVTLPGGGPAGPPFTVGVCYSGTQHLPLYVSPIVAAPATMDHLPGIGS